MLLQTIEQHLLGGMLHGSRQRRRHSHTSEAKFWGCSGSRTLMIKILQSFSYHTRCHGFKGQISLADAYECQSLRWLFCSHTEKTRFWGTWMNECRVNPLQQSSRPLMCWRLLESELRARLPAGPLLFCSSCEGKSSWVVALGLCFLHKSSTCGL